MWAVSDDFLKAVKSSHQMVTKVEVYEGIGGELLYRSDDLTSEHIDGQVNIGRDVIRRRCSCSFVDTTGALTPADVGDVFSPFGNEIQMYRGVKFFDGSTEYVPLGRFGVSDVEVDDSGEGLTISVDAYDRARRVQRAKMTQGITNYSSDSNISAVIKLLISSSVPNLVFNFVDGPVFRFPFALAEGGDIWDYSQKFAASIGFELFFDQVGRCVFRPVPDYSEVPPDIEYEEGEDSTLLNINKRLTDEEVFNHFIVTGENSSGVSVRGDASDTNPLSPTYVLGKYGYATAPVENSPLVFNETQAKAAATAKLQNNLGSFERIHFNAIVNPSHDIGDVLQIKRAKSKVNDRYVLNSASIPLSHNRAMDVTARLRVAYADES